MQAVPFGPWVFPVGIIAIALGWFAASVIAAFLRRRGYADAASALWWLLLAALVAGRAAFVVRWWPAYHASAWWSILDIRDRGFMPLAAVLALVLVTPLVVLGRPRLRLALPVAAAGGLAVAALTVFAAVRLQASSHPPLSSAALRQLDGGTTTLASFAGKPMVVNLWATWCGPCRSEMPMLIEASHATPGVRFVFADQGESAAKVRAFLATQSMQPAHVLLDPESDLSRDYRAPGYPTTLFIDADGRLRDTRVGPLSRATLEQHLLRITPTYQRSIPAP